MRARCPRHERGGETEVVVRLVHNSRRPIPKALGAAKERGVEALPSGRARFSLLLQIQLAETLQLGTR